MSDLYSSEKLPRTHQAFGLDRGKDVEGHNLVLILYQGFSRLVDSWMIAGLMKKFSEQKTDLLVNTTDVNEGEYDNIGADTDGDEDYS